MSESKCPNRQREIEYYRKLGLELGECTIASYSNPQKCELRNRCGRHIGGDTK